MPLIKLQRLLICIQDKCISIRSHWPKLAFSSLESTSINKLNKDGNHDGRCTFHGSPVWSLETYRPWESTKPNINNPRLGLGRWGMQSQACSCHGFEMTTFFYKVFHIYSICVLFFMFKLMFCIVLLSRLQWKVLFAGCSIGLVSVSQGIWGQTMVRLSSRVGIR